MNAPGTTKPVALRYQDQRGLDEVPAYTTGLQLRLADGQQVYLALSNVEFAIHFSSEKVLHYDLTGRLEMIAETDCYQRRSLSHRVLLTRKLPREDGGGIARMALPPAAADMLVNEAQALALIVHDALQRGTAILELAKPSATTALHELRPHLDRAAQFDVRAAQLDARRFREVYGRVAVLPPDQYNALVVQATEGCAYNDCLFCELYRGARFQRKSPVQFRRHVEEVISYHGESLRARRSIFLGEANALTLPQADLVEMLHVLHEHFELPAPDQGQPPASWWMGHPHRFDGLSSFQDAFAGPHRTTAQFAELHRLGLRRVYIGMETGDDALLKWLHKPATHYSITQVVTALKEANITVGVIVLLGAGGQQFSATHIRESARLINSLPLGRGDYIYFSPLETTPCGHYDVKALANGIHHLTDTELREQEAAIRAALRFDTKRGRPYLARYELETFVY